MKSKHWSTTCLKIYCLNTRNWRWTLLWRWCMCTWRMAWSVRSSRWWVRLTGCRIWEWNWQVSITAHSQKVDSSAEVLFFNLRCKQYLFNRHGAAANVILYSYSLVEMNKILSNCCHTTFFLFTKFQVPLANGPDGNRKPLLSFYLKYPSTTRRKTRHQTLLTHPIQKHLVHLNQ